MTCVTASLDVGLPCARQCVHLRLTLDPVHVCGYQQSAHAYSGTAYCEAHGANQAPHQGATMADKSPRQHLSKKAGRSLKQKRADKRARAEGKSRTETVTPDRKS